MALAVCSRRTMAIFGSAVLSRWAWEKARLALSEGVTLRCQWKGRRCSKRSRKIRASSIHFFCGSDGEEANLPDLQGGLSTTRSGLKVVTGEPALPKKCLFSPVLSRQGSFLFGRNGLLDLQGLRDDPDEVFPQVGAGDG